MYLVLVFCFWISTYLLFTQQHIGGYIFRNYGARFAVFLGGSLISLGYIIASQATSLLELILTYGVMFGVGMGISAAAPICW